MRWNSASRSAGVRLACHCEWARVARPSAASRSRPVGLPCLSLRISPPAGLGGGAGDARRFHGFGVDECRVPAGVREQHRVIRRGRAQRSVQREALDIRLRRAVPLRLVPAAPHDPLARPGLPGRPGHLGDDLVPCARLPQIQPQVELAHPHEMAVPLDEAGDGQHPAQVDNPGLRPDPGARGGVGPHRRDAVAAHGEGLRQRRRLIQGDDPAVAQNQVRRRRILRQGGAGKEQQGIAHGSYQDTEPLPAPVRRR